MRDGDLRDIIRKIPKSMTPESTIMRRKDGTKIHYRNVRGNAEITSHPDRKKDGSERTYEIRG